MEIVINEKIKLVYSESTYSYINELILHFKNNCEYVMQFFNKKTLNKPLIITIWDDKEEFKKEMSKLSGIDDIPDWAIGMANSKSENEITHIDCLSLENIKKIPYHSDKTLDDMKKLIVHEFTHVCHDEYTNYDENIPTWVQEGVAVYLSNQYENAELTVSIDEIKNDNMVSYNNYRYVFDRVASGCLKEELLDLLNGKNAEKVLDNISLQNKK